MTGHATVGWVDIVVIVGYLLTTGYLGWLGYRGTRTAADFLVGGRSRSPHRHGRLLRGDLHLHLGHRRLRRGRRALRHEPDLAHLLQHRRGHPGGLHGTRGADPAPGPSPGGPHLPGTAGGALPEQGYPGLCRGAHLPLHAPVLGGGHDRRCHLRRDPVRGGLRGGPADLRPGDGGLCDPRRAQGGDVYGHLPGVRDDRRHDLPAVVHLLQPGRRDGGPSRPHRPGRSGPAAPPGHGPSGLDGHAGLRLGGHDLRPVVDRDHGHHPRGGDRGPGPAPVGGALHDGAQPPRTGPGRAHRRRLHPAHGRHALRDRQPVQRLVRSARTPAPVVRW